MEMKWFIDINGKAEGPYRFFDLKRDRRLTPDTLVWREGFPKWLKMRDVPELQEIFKDDDDKKDAPEPTKLKLKSTGKDELAIDMRAPPPIIFWLLITTILVTFFLYQVLFAE